MSEASEGENSLGGAEPDSDERKGPLADRPWLRLAVIVIGLLGTGMSIALGIRAFATSAAPPNPTTASSISSAATSTIASTTAGSIVGSASAAAATVASATAVEMGVVVGECLDETGQALPCNAVHHYEVIASTREPCDAAAVVEYLGGNPNLDLPRVNTKSAFDACVVSSADDALWTGSVRGAFSGGSDSALADDLRRCRDDRVGSVEVSCSGEHTGEYVGVPQGVVPDERQCLEAAEAYAGVNFERGDKPELKVVTLPVTNPLDGRPHCVVAVRGNNVLTSSVRNIRTTSLPLAPG